MQTTVFFFNKDLGAEGGVGGASTTEPASETTGVFL